MGKVRRLKSTHQIPASAQRHTIQFLTIALGRAFPVLLFLACALVWVHQAHVLRFMEPLMMRLVYQVEREACLPWLSGRATAAVEKEPAGCSALGGRFPPLPGLKFAEQQTPQVAGMPVAGRGGAAARPGPHIRILDLDTSAFDVLFERRLPLPRGCLAEVLLHLAASLPEPQPGAALPVVMLDMDVTIEVGQRSAIPLRAPGGQADAGGVPCQDASRDRQIDEALAALVRKSVVVALMLARPTPQARARRDAHRAALCQRFGQGTPQQGRGMLHLAADKVFWRAQEPLYEFPLWRRADAPALTVTAPLTPAFPSLGVLAGLAWRIQHGADLSTQDRALVNDSLVAACAPGAGAAPQAAGLQAFIGDQLTTDDGATLAGFDSAYEFRKLNLLQAGLGISTSTFSAEQAGPPDGSRQKQGLLRALAEPVGLGQPGILAVAVQDGSSADSFSTPNNTKSGTPGVWVQAAMAFSTASAYLREPSHLKLWLLDVLIGSAYALIVGLCVAPPARHHQWTALSPWRAWVARLRTRWPGAMLLAMVLVVALVMSVWGAPVWRGPAQAAGTLAWIAALVLAVSSLVPDRPHGAGHWPFVRNAWHLVVPILVAVIMVSTGFYLSALQLPLGVWFDPLFMTVGMAMHAYLELPHLAHASAPEARAPLWRLFLQAAWSATDVNADGVASRRWPDRVLAGSWRVAWLALLLGTLSHLVWAPH